eukprot:TRINITY_DN185_c0_g1_i5.p1 TRINITY_DN185_c0_g1~~TRINITY_DN185_c0_g1_i5.p1  ORF type:complete len:638 (-),score=109.76 TRINITY_DN185_c0_g1_i5:428-2341(-)
MKSSTFVAVVLFVATVFMATTVMALADQQQGDLNTPLLDEVIAEMDAEVLSASESESESFSSSLDGPSNPSVTLVETQFLEETASSSKSSTPEPAPSASVSTTIGADEPVRRDAIAVLTAVKPTQGISGTIEVECDSRVDCESGRVVVTYNLVATNVPDGEYSLNLYEFGSLEDTVSNGNDGKTTGRYFLTGPGVRQCTSNSPQAGDLGNVEVFNGLVKGNFIKSNVFLTGDKSVVGRGIAIERAECSIDKDGKDTLKYGVGVVGIAKPEDGVRSVATSGAAPSSVQRGVCVVQGATVNGVVSLSVASKSVDVLTVEAEFEADAAREYYLELFTYGDLTNTTDGASLGGVNGVRFGAQGLLRADGQNDDNNKFEYKAAFNATGLNIVGGANVIGKGMAVVGFTGGVRSVYGTCAIGLTGEVADRVCTTPTAANFNQKAPCIMAAKLMPFGVATDLKVPGGPTFSVGAKSLSKDVFVEVFEVLEDFGKPDLGTGFSDTKVLSSFEFEPAGTQFVAGQEPVVKFEVTVEKGYDPYAIISNDGVKWEQLINIQYKNGELSGQVAHFSYIAAAAAKATKKDDDDDNAVALGVGLGVGLGGSLLIGAAGYFYYQKNKSESGSGESGNGTSHPLTPQDKYGNI